MNNLKQLWNHGSISSFFPGFFALSVFSMIFGAFLICPLIAQPEVMAWGNLTGIRVEGQLMEFESNLRVV